MRLNRLILKNIKSFRDTTEISFDPQTTLFIGPNGGGKSNLMNTLSWVLNSRFYRPFAYQIQNNRAVLQLHNYADSAPEPHWAEEDKPSFVWIEFQVTDEDVEGMRDYWRNKDRLKKSFEDMVNWDANSKIDKKDALADFDKGIVDPDAYNLQPGSLMRYRIEITRESKYSANIIAVDQADLAIHDDRSVLYDAYLRYLTDAELRKTLQNDNIVALPYILYSPSREPHDLSMNLSGGSNLTDMTRNYHNEMQNFVFNSKGSSQLLTQIAAFVIGHEVVDLVYAGGMDFAEKNFDKSDTSRRIAKELAVFGFKWNVHVINKLANHFIVAIAKVQEEEYFSVTQASSGERQLLNFIFGLTSSAVNNSLIIIDEPELNLHPRWQKLLLKFFLRIQEEKNCQFVISTHSASFLDEATLPHVRRIYRLNQASALSADHGGGESAPIFQDAIKLLNAQQNERIFFTQKAVLVEGPSDFVIWQKLINTLLEIFGIGEIYEVIEVLGSANFTKYRTFLDLFEIESYIIADLDYIGIIGDDQVKSIFRRFSDESEASKRILKSHSIDRSRLIERIETALDKDDPRDLRAMINYLRMKNSRIDISSLSSEETETLREFRRGRESDRIFVLEKGALESYYIIDDIEQGALKKDTDKAIAFASNDKAFKEWMLKGARHLRGDALTVRDKVMADEAAEFIGIALRIIGLEVTAANGSIIRDAISGDRLSGNERKRNR